MSLRQRRGPLRKIVALLLASDDAFSPDLVELECGHQVRSNGIYRARCAKCAASAAVLPTHPAGSPP